MIKRWMAGIMAAVVMLCTVAQPRDMFAASWYAADDAAADLQTTLENGDINKEQHGVSVQARNDFGQLLADKISVQAAKQEENNGCNIFSVEMQQNTAEVSFETSEDATLITAIYDEAGTHLLASGSTEVLEGDTKAKIAVEGTVPQFFYIRGFLVDSETMRPLCREYESPMYTREMQEFLAKTVLDFDQDRVLNLDNDEKNNFAVFNDHVKIIEKQDGVNTVVSADAKQRIYAFENADAAITSLQQGDIFVYPYGENELLIVKAASVEVNGNTVIVTGSDMQMEEAFDYVKIDTESGAADAETDMSSLGEGIQYEGLVHYEDGEQAHLNALQTENKYSEAFKWQFLDYKPYSSDNEKAEVKMNGSLELKLEAGIKVYISSTYQYLEVKFQLAGTFKLNVSAKIKLAEIPIGKVSFSPIPGVLIGLEPSLKMSIEGKADFSGKVSITLGAAVSSDSGEVQNLCSAPKIKFNAKGEMTVYVGFGLKPSIAILHESVAGVELGASVGAEVKASLALYESSLSSSKVHACNQCLDGDIIGKAELEFKAQLLNSKKLTYTKKFTTELKLADFYYSFDFDEFALTACPHYKFKINIMTVDNEGNAVTGAEIADQFSVDKNNPGESVKDAADFIDVDKIVTGQEGKALGYLPAGKHTLLISADGYRKTMQKIEIIDESKNVRVILWQDGKKPTGTNPDGNGQIRPGDTEEPDGGEDSEQPGDEEKPGEQPPGDEQPGDSEIEAVTMISLGEDYSGTITKDGSLYMWGMNDKGQLGDGTNTNRKVPVKVLDNVADITLGAGCNGAITKDGSLYMWGDNYKGQVGDGTNANRNTPVKVLNNVIKLVLGGSYSGAITEDGSLYMWGNNFYGQLGNGTFTNQNTPIKILDNVKEVSFGSLGQDYNGAITKDGSLYMWGNNSDGQVGNGAINTNQNTPVKILNNVEKMILVGDNSGAITKDGSLYMWGNNYKGQVGDGTLTDQNVPMKILDNVGEVNLEGNHSGAITKDGSLYMWGDNHSGQVGDGRKNMLQKTPVKILDNVSELNLGGDYSGAITKDGSLYMWGSNGDGRLGDGTEIDRYMPVKILDNVEEVNLEGFCYYNGAITKDKSLYMWGLNYDGRLGDGTEINRNVPVKIMNNVEKVSLVRGCNGAVMKYGSLYMWGLNNNGQLGDGTIENRLVPTKISFSKEGSLAETYSGSDTQTIPKAKLLSTQTETAPVSGSAAIVAELEPKEIVQTPAFQKTFTGLAPEGLYHFYIMKSRTAQQPFSADNLLYIAQYTADSSGTLAVSCTPKEMAEGMEAFVVGDIQLDLSKAQIEVKNLTYNGTEQSVWPKVTYQNKTLVEGVDYILLGDFRVKNAGKYSVTASGTGFYKGEISADYQMLYKNTQSGGSTGGGSGSYNPVYPYHPPASSENADPQTKPGQADSSQTDDPEQSDNQTDPSDKPSAVIYKKGCQVTDASSGGVYEITKMPYSNGTGGTVSYLKSLNKQAAAVTIPDTITLGDMIFKVTKIADGAFQSSTKLTKAVIGNSIRIIGSKAFYKCTKLKAVLFGKRVKTIGPKAFCKCTVLTKITLPDSTAVIGNQAFYECKKLKTVTLGNGLREIGKQAFYQCVSLVKIKLSNVSVIGNQAFYGCKNIKSVLLGNELTVIGSKAFYACTNLEKIIIPVKVSSIGRKAFYGCSSLKQIVCKTKKLTAKNVGAQAFAGTHIKVKVKAPKRVLKQYRKLLRARGLHKKL